MKDLLFPYMQHEKLIYENMKNLLLHGMKLVRGMKISYIRNMFIYDIMKILLFHGMKT